MSIRDKVSIIVPVYNVEDYLDDCIESLLSQTHTNIEIILVNDSSTDSSGIICDNYAKEYSHIKVLHKPNEGVNYARRDGFRESEGEFISFVDSDDIIPPNFIKTHLELLKSTSADITVGKVHSFYGISLSQNEIDQCRVKGTTPDFIVWTKKKDVLSAFITSLPPYGNMALMCMWSKLYRRNIIENIDWDKANYSHGEDYFVNTQAYYNANSVCYINDYSYYYRRNRLGKLTLNAYSNMSPKGIEISNLHYVKELTEMYKKLSKNAKLDLSNEIIISQCRLYTYWLDKLIDMNGLSLSLWNDYILKELIPLIPKFKSKGFNEYMEKNLTSGGKLHKELSTKLDQIYKYQEIEKYLQHKVSTLKELASNPQNHIDYRNSWVIMDRPDSSTDNGYHFYKWMKKHQPNINLFYVINSDSKDVSRLKAEGFNLVFTKTNEHNRLLNKCVVEIYAYYTFNLCEKRTSFNSLKVYLGHGVKLNNSLNPGLGEDDLFVTTFKREYEFFKKKRKDFTPIQTGLPRFRSLIRQPDTSKEIIVIAPQWRRWLGKKATRNDFYFVQWSNFLKSKELKKLSLKYKIIFIIHPELEMKVNLLDIPKYIKSIRYSDLGVRKLQKLITQTKLMITDFSSVAVDYTIAGSDLIYFQFDREEYYKNHTAEKGWFDYDIDGFGPVFFDLDSIAKYIANYKENQQTHNSIYKDRLKNLIGKDSQILNSPSQNIYEHIIASLRKKRLEGETN